MKQKFLLLIAAFCALTVNAKVIDLSTMAATIDEWTPGDGATLNQSETDALSGKYVYDIVGGSANEAFMNSEPDLVFRTQNSSNKAKAFNIYPGQYFMFGGKNGVTIIKNTHAADKIVISVASKGSTAAGFLDSNGTYPKNAINKSTNLSLPAKDVNYEWTELEYLSLGGDVEIKEFSGGYVIRSVSIVPSETISCADAVQLGSKLSSGAVTTDSITVVGYITSIVNAYDSNNGTMSFWMADTRDGGNQFEAYRVSVPEELVIGTKVAVTSVLKNYNGTYETYMGRLSVLDNEQPNPDPVDPEPENPDVEPVRTGLYIMGAFNNWTANPAYEFLQSTVSNTYYIENVTVSEEFIIGQEDGNTYAGSNGTRIQANTTYSLGYYSGENIRCEFASMSCAKITLDPNNGTLLLQGEAVPRTYETITVRIDPYSVDWTSLYAYVWTGNEDMSSAYYQSGAQRVVWAQKAQTDAEGWGVVSFMLEQNETYHLSWQESSDPVYYYSGYCLTNQQGSVCTAYSTSGQLRTVQCRGLLPSEENSYTINVVTAGTFGQLMVQALGEHTWVDVYALTITGSLNESDLQYFGRMANLQQLDLSGANTRSMGGCANLNKLSTVVLPASCTVINDNAFYQCKRLKSINLNAIRTVGNRAFYQCTAIKNLNMPLVTSIGAYAFAEGVLVSANIPLVQSIDEYAFYANPGLASVTMPIVTSIGRNAFEYCYALTQLDISNATTIGERAFNMDDRNGHITQVLLSDELETIPHKCFYGNPDLTTIALPAALKTIESEALPNVVDVQLPQGVTAVGSDNFNNASSITIPSQVVSWNAYSSSWQEVYCHIVAPITFYTFIRDEVENMTLYVPAVSLAAYKLHDGWYRFGHIFPMEGEVDDMNIRYSAYSLLSTTGLAEPADVTVGTEGALTVSTSNPLQIGNYTQYVSGYKRYRRYYYDDDGKDEPSVYYFYMPYTGLLMANSPITANAPVIRYVPAADRWNFFSLPFDVNMADITIGTEGSGMAGTSQWVIREYSGANRAAGNGATWNNVPANGMLHAHTGYILYWMVEGGNETNDNFYYYFNMPAANNGNKQNIFTTADVSVPLMEYSAEYPQNSSWNLVGNPYPCMFDSRQMDIDAPITVWNGNGYSAYSIQDDNYILRPAEAFFVQAPQGTSAIVFHKEGRSGDLYPSASEQEAYNNNYYYTPRRMTDSGVRKVFNFLLSNADYTDRARLVLNENATAGYEITRDAAKMMSSDNTVPQLYVSDNGLHYAIDERPDTNNGYVLGAFFGKAGEYTLRLSAPATEDRRIILTDTETLISTDLKENEYTFTTEAGSFSNRFTISFVPQIFTGMDELNSLNAPKKTLENGRLIITTPQGKKYTVGGTEL